MKTNWMMRPKLSRCWFLNRSQTNYGEHSGTCIARAQEGSLLLLRQFTPCITCGCLMKTRRYYIATNSSKGWLGMFKTSWRATHPSRSLMATLQPLSGSSICYQFWSASKSISHWKALESWRWSLISGEPPSWRSRTMLMHTLRFSTRKIIEVHSTGYKRKYFRKI